MSFVRVGRLWVADPRASCGAQTGPMLASRDIGQGNIIHWQLGRGLRHYGEQTDSDKST